MAFSLAVLGFFACFALIVGSAKYFADRSGAEAVVALAQDPADVVIVLSAGLDRARALDAFSRAGWRRGSRSGAPAPRRTC